MTKKEYESVYELAKSVEKRKADFQGVRMLSPGNYERFMKVFAYFQKLAQESGGVVSHVDIEPQSVHADVSIKIPLVDLFKREMNVGLADILRDVDVFGITPTTDGQLLIDASVNYVWEEFAK